MNVTITKEIRREEHYLYIYIASLEKHLRVNVTMKEEKTYQDGCRC